MDSQHGASHSNPTTNRTRNITRSITSSQNNQMPNNNAHINDYQREDEQINQIDIPEVHNENEEAENENDDNDIQSLLNNDSRIHLPPIDNNFQNNLHMHLLANLERRLDELQAENNHLRTLQRPQPLPVPCSHPSTQTFKQTEITKRKRIRSSSSSSSSYSPTTTNKTLRVDPKSEKRYVPIEKLKVPAFTGDLKKDGYDFVKWKQMTIRYFNRISTSLDDKLDALNRAITGTAGNLLIACSFEDINEVFDTLEKTYTHITSNDLLYNIRQGEDETVAECYARILSEIRISKKITKEGEEETVLEVLRKALKPEILEKLNIVRFKNVSDMLFSARQFEAELRDLKQKSTNNKVTKSPTKIGTALNLLSEELGVENAENLKKQIINIQRSNKPNQTNQVKSFNNNNNNSNHNNNHRNNNQQSSQRYNNYSNNFRPRHDRNQPNTTYNSNERSRYNQFQNQSKPRYQQGCYHCKKPGHSYLECRFATQADKDKIAAQFNQRNFMFQNISHEPRQEQQHSLNDSTMAEKPRRS